MNCPNCDSGDVYDGQCHACGHELEPMEFDEFDYDDYHGGLLPEDDDDSREER